MSLRVEELEGFTDALRTWAPGIQDHNRLQEMASFLLNLTATVQGNAKGSSAQQALQQIRQALIKSHLKSTNELQHVSNTALEVMFPDSNFSCDFRSSMFISWAQFKVDLAFMLVNRDDDFERCSIRFGWSDSSPQGPFDFLVWKHRAIYASELLKVADAMISLVNSPGGVYGGDVGADAEIPVGTPEAREAANKVLKDEIREHVYAPLCCCCGGCCYGCS